MAVLLVLEPTQKRSHYPPLLSAMERLGAQRLLKTAWLIEGASAADVWRTLSTYTPITDGVIVADMSHMEHRRATRDGG